MRPALIVLLLGLIGGALYFVLRAETPTPERSAAQERVPASRPAVAPSPPPAAGDVLRGRVVEAGSGAPVAGAMVVVGNEQVCFTDAAGGFLASTRGVRHYAQFRVTSASHGSVLVDREIDAGDVVIEVVPGLAVAGRVVTRSSDGVPGYHLQQVGESEAWTNDDGRFATGGHAAGSIRLLVEGERRFCEAGDTDVRIVLDGAFLFVRTVDESGAPVRGVRLGWTGEVTEESGPIEGGQAWQDWFLVRHAPGEGVTGTFEKPGFLPQRFEWSPKSAAAGVSRETVVLQRRPPNSMAIDVYFADGSAPKTATFTLKDASGLQLVGEQVALTNGHGRVDGLPEGSYDASVFGDAEFALGVEQPVTIRNGNDNQALFSLEAGALVAVRWPDYAARYYRLVLRSEAEPERWLVLDESRSRGWWTLATRLPFGRYRLCETKKREIFREQIVEIAGTDPIYVDWSKEQAE